MPGDHRQAEPDLTRRIVGEGHLFDFFQLVHLLETWQAARAAVGRGGPFPREVLRFKPDASLTFSPADVRRVEEAGGDERQRGETWKYRIVVNFMGLYGVASPTPVYLSELVGFTDVDAEPLTDFLDLFNHRILSFFYRAWVKYRYPYRYEPGGKDEFSGYALSFAGLGEPEVRRLANLPAHRLIKYLGLLSQRTRPPVCLALLIGDYFGGVPVDVAEWAFRWVPIPPEGRNRVGVANSRLGVDLSVGERVPDRAGKFRVAIGPLGFDDYLRYLPDQRRYTELCGLVRLWSFKRFDYDVAFTIKGGEIPQARLGTTTPARLGWTSWITSEPGMLYDPSVTFAKREATPSASPGEVAR